ncbi:MAG: TonB family protein [Terracidiphilus sp.]
MNGVSPSDWIGRTVDERFPLEEWLGGSAHSGVFRTELAGDPPQKAAIKLMWQEPGEAEHGPLPAVPAADLSHPHLMPLLHAGNCEMEGVAMRYVVMEYADEVLSSLLPERPLTAREMREMLQPILDVLAYLHGHGIVHAHLKPSNILVVEDQLKISADSLCLANTSAPRPAATSIYDAPEVTLGGISPAADLWSLGVMIVEALTQHPPEWDRTTQAAPAIPPAVPEPFARIARACLQPAPSQRCSLDHVRDWLLGLAAIPGTLPPPAPAPNATPSKEGQPKAVSLRVVQGLVAAVVLMIAVSTVLHLQSRNSASTTVTPPSSSQPSQDAAATAPAPAPMPAATQTPEVPAASTSPAAAIPEPERREEPEAGGDVVHRAMPEVLPAAQQSIEGKVRIAVRVAVDPSGNVTSATLASPEHSKYFTRISLEAAQKWRFKPAASESAWVLHFEYRQSGVEVTSTEEKP